jgi:hypothetical protein
MIMKSNFTVNKNNIIKHWESTVVLPKMYKKIVKSGFIFKKEHYFLKRLFNTTYFNWENYSSKGMREYFVNSVYLDVDDGNFDDVIQSFILLSRAFYLKFIEIDKKDSNLTIVLISNENNAELKIFVSRVDEPPVLIEDLNKYGSEKIMVLDRCSIDEITKLVKNDVYKNLSNK